MDGKREKEREREELNSSCQGGGTDTAITVAVGPCTVMECHQLFTTKERRGRKSGNAMDLADAGCAQLVFPNC